MALASASDLTGLSTAPRSATAAMFAPCREHHFRCPADHAICRALQDLGRSADPVYCGIAAYRGSWERPDTKFADAVRSNC